MDHTTQTSSKDAGGNYHMYRDSQLLQQTNEAGGQQSMPMFQGSFSMGASQNRPFSHFHTSASPFCQLFEGDGCSTHTPPHIRDLAHPYRRHVSGMIHHNTNHGTFHIPAPSCISPEGLLDIILVAQQKLHQLQAIVELMVRVGGQAEEHQSLAAGVKSIMSQLFAATASLCQQPPDLFSGLSQSCGGVDLRFDGFNYSGMNSSVSAMGAGMRSVETRTPSLLGDSELQTQTMEPALIKGTEISRPCGEVDSRFKEQGSNALFGDPSNQLAHSDTVANFVEIDISNESLRIACDGNAINGNQDGEDHEFTNVSRDDDDDGEGENLPPGSYELVEMGAAEILAEHTHFCEICGKGFKRDANLRMHMRGHGDEYKTPAALARPDKSSACPTIVKLRRYSCPFLGCKRNKQHRKFLPLKTILCVKNHYRRSHCPKLLTCSKCKIKKFSVVADLKTHEKHCGQEKWQCSCGTTFSRKDKLSGHVNLFAGHAPVVSSCEMENLSEPPSDSLTTEFVEGLECLEASKATSPAPSKDGLALSSSFKSANSRITDSTVMGADIFIGDEIGQQRTVFHGEKSFLVDNSQIGAMKVLQHCG